MNRLVLARGLMIVAAAIILAQIASFTAGGEINRVALICAIGAGVAAQFARARKDAV